MASSNFAPQLVSQQGGDSGGLFQSQQGGGQPQKGGVGARRFDVDGKEVYVRPGFTLQAHGYVFFLLVLSIYASRPTPSSFVNKHSISKFN